MADRDSFDKSQSRLSPVSSSNSQQQDTRQQGRLYLPLLFEPGNWDVICHNGREFQEHVGNSRFKLCIERNLDIYMNAGSRLERSTIITDIVTGIREGGGGFVRYDQAEMRWYDVGDKIARDKAGQALRDSLRLRNDERKQVRASGMQQRVETSKFSMPERTPQAMISNLSETAPTIKMLTGNDKIAMRSDGRQLSPTDLFHGISPPKDLTESAESSPDTLYQLSKEVTSVDSSALKNGEPPTPEEWLTLENIGSKHD
ncbi:unnamed protein product [Cylindrotheca closterium]|uniref:DUF6824 domain-containing protein n=1 Tax=Cylindrotheca closterium TaxID=2856 RepID=A0AAD2CE91_9STRA|nr:unnamed protein product [Cylindrotheca closterium]